MCIKSTFKDLKNYKLFILSTHIFIKFSEETFMLTVATNVQYMLL